MPTQSQHTDISLHQSSSEDSVDNSFDFSITGGTNSLPSKLMRQWNTGTSLRRNTGTSVLIIPVHDKAILKNTEDVQHIHPLSMDWYLELMRNHNRELSKKEIVRIVNGINGLIREKEYRRLENLLTNIPSNESSIITLVTLLRTSYSVRIYLKSWSQLLQNAQDWVKNKGYDPEKVLVGMI